MTFLTERLAALRKHLEHLRALRPRVEDARSLERDLSLHNDVLFSLLSVAQLVIDVSGELGARQGLKFDDYTQAVRNLSMVGGFRRRSWSGWPAFPGSATCSCTTM